MSNASGRAVLAAIAFAVVLAGCSTRLLYGEAPEQPVYAYREAQPDTPFSYFAARFATVAVDTLD